MIPVLIGISAAGLAYFISSASSKIDAAKNIDYKFGNPSLRFKSLTEFELGIDFTLNNASGEVFTIKHPAINLLQSGSQLAKNDYINKTYTLPANGSVTLDRLFFTISTFKCVGDLSNIIKNAGAAWVPGAGLSQNLANVTAALMAQKDDLLKKMSVSVTTEVNSIPVVYNQTNLSGIGDAPNAIDRPITPCPEYDKYFPAPKGIKIKYKADTVEDTSKLMVDIVNQDYQLIKDFAQLFKRKTKKETAQAIFEFVFKHIKYNLEDGEQLRSPLVTYDLGQRKAREFYKKYGYWNKEYSADCDCISIFNACILKNLNIPYAFRVSSYKDYLGFEKGYSHVYVVIPDGCKTIIIDPVYHSFNKEKPTSKAFNMSGQSKQLVKLNGINDMDVYYLGNQDDDIFAYLQKTRAALAQQKQDPNVISMFDYAIKYWNTNRQGALDYLEKAEKQMNLTNVGFFGALNMISNRRALTFQRPMTAEEKIKLEGLVSDNLKAFIQKYKIPVAIGTGLLALAAAYGIKVMINNRKKAVTA